jgi:ligand-binding sensor domain-containing protein/AraC-like DNA-binding protein
MGKRLNLGPTGKPSVTIFILIIIHLFWFQLWALDPNKTVDQYLVDQWGLSDGIPSDTILSISQTHDGYLWLATSGGLVKFDGMKFSVIPFTAREEVFPEETFPITLFLDREGALWIGSDAGLTLYNRQTGRFKTFTPADGLTGDRIRRIKDDMNGNLWITFFSSYANRFSNGKFFAFDSSHGLEGKKIDAIVEDRKGNLLFGSRENGVFIYKDGKFSGYSIPGLDKSHTITTMYEDSKGDLWIGTTNGLLKVTDKGYKMYTTGTGLTDNFITSILEDSDRNIWIGTTAGLNRTKKNQEDSPGFDSLLKSLKIYCLFEDREKNLWVGTYGSGLKRLKNRKFISYAPLEGFRQEILLSLFEDRHGDTWIGTLSGRLFHCRGRNIIEIIEPPEFSGKGIAAIAEDAAGNLWLGTNGRGVFQKKEGTYMQFTTREGLADNLVTSIYKDSRNDLWFCTFDGVSVLRYAGRVIESLTARDGLPGKVVNNVYEDRNQNIWIASDKGITVIRDGKIAKENLQFYLHGISVTCLYEDPSGPAATDKVYWIATYGAGLKRLTLKDGTVTTYKTEHGMTTNFIYQFFEDQQGNFWLMGKRDILCVSKSELNRFAKGGTDKINCISYGISDGMKSCEFNNEFSRNSALKAGNGEFWFVTRKGISIVNPAKIRVNKLAPPVVIEKVFFNRKSIPLHSDAAEGAYTCNAITDFSFHFTAPTFLSPEKIKFKYRMQGVNREWVFLPPGEERVARYRDLTPGTYTFRVTACNAEGIWNRTGDSVSFIIKPFFYQTSLFKMGLLLLLAALFTAAFYIYKKRPFDKKRKYEGSTLNPHFAKECIRKLEYQVEIEKVYRDADISLQSLAKKLSISPHILSRILNEKLNRNFHDFINYHRIEEVKRILENLEVSEKTISSAAYEVGFNTIAAFYKVFKKYTGKTPAEYKKAKTEK